MEKTDIYYIEKVLRGETRYFSYLVEKYKDIVFSIALKVLKNRENAEEAAQESFIKAYRSIGSYQGKAKFSTWLYRITYNHCISETRKKKVYHSSSDEIEIKDSDTVPPLEDIPEEKRAVYVKTAMDKLPQEDYMLILLYYFEDHSMEEISRVTGLSESNTKVKLHRARKKLGGILDDMLKEELYTIL